VTLDDLNRAPRNDAERALRACCNSGRWVEALLALRPFTSVDALAKASDIAWRQTGPNDWREAIAGHPRIGERSAPSADDRSGNWSVREQSAIDTASDATRAELAAANREYEARFGHIFLVSATGKSASELLDIVRRRLQNEPDAELAIAGEELRQIARLRLEKLIAANAEARR
jgi:2-oxo-4-hydroxy-4-carboxy-5-ureidoimidazoline decarboxylase